MAKRPAAARAFDPQYVIYGCGSVSFDSTRSGQLGWRTMYGVGEQRATGE